MLLKEQIEKIQEVSGRYHAELAPLVEQVKPYLEAARRAEALGLTADSSEDDIINAFAASVDIDPQVRAAVPSVLSAAAPAEIRKAAEDFLRGWGLLGQAAGQLGGIIAGLGT